MTEKVVIGNATLFRGDCIEVLAGLPPCFRVDAVITDPPYGVQFSGKVAKQRDGSVSAGDGGYLSTDDTPEYVRSVVVPALVAALALAKRGAVTPGTRNMFAYPEPASVGAFYSAAGTGLSSWGFKCSQPILYYGKCPYMSTGKGARADSMGQTYPNDANASGHPCAKPLAQMLWLVERASLTGDSVLDPFMGSGTTGAASLMLGRAFVGIEIEPRYFDIACRRIEDAQKQTALFPHEPEPQPEQLSLA